MEHAQQEHNVQIEEEEEEAPTHMLSKEASPLVIPPLSK